MELRFPEVPDGPWMEESVEPGEPEIAPDPETWGPGILLVSGYLDHEALRTVDELGTEAILHKPYDRESLHRAVERALGSE